jgi:hypothetical protein
MPLSLTTAMFDASSDLPKDEPLAIPPLGDTTASVDVSGKPSFQKRRVEPH